MRCGRISHLAPVRVQTLFRPRSRVMRDDTSSWLWQLGICCLLLLPRPSKLDACSLKVKGKPCHTPLVRCPFPFHRPETQMDKPLKYVTRAPRRQTYGYLSTCRASPPISRCQIIHSMKWRHSNLWSRYDLHVVGHDVVMCEVNWWRFVTLLK